MHSLPRETRLMSDIAYNATPNNTTVCLGGKRKPGDDMSGQVCFHFYRRVPFTRFQVWMLEWCFGFGVEQGDES